MSPLLFVIAALASQSQAAPDRFTLVQQGRKLYQEKQYDKSADAYQLAVRGGDHTALTNYDFACSLALSGKTDQAFAALGTSMKAGFHNTLQLAGDPDLKSLRADKRWQDVVQVCKKNSEAREARMANPESARINTDNIRRFWRAYEEAEKVDPKERPAIYDKLYFRDADGPLTYFLLRASMTPALMAWLVDSKPQYFQVLHSHHADFSDQAKDLRAAFEQFKRLYPEAKFPDTYVTIGGFSSGGTANDDGLIIGAELFGLYPDTPMKEMNAWQARVLGPQSDFVPLAVHECVHFQQRPLGAQTLLATSLREGSADFVSFLVTGKMMDRIRNLHFWANSRERELWLEFKSEMGGKSTKGWLYGDPKPGWPDDVGYWLGYKICETYYGHAEDKRQALKDILSMTNAEAFLDASHYADKFGA